MNFLSVDQIAWNETVTYWPKLLFGGGVLKWQFWPAIVTYILPLFQPQLRAPNAQELVSHNPVSICPLNSELFLRRTPKPTRAPKHSALSPSLFSPCVSQGNHLLKCELKHHLSAGSSHGDFTSPAPPIQFKITAFSLENVRLVSGHVARRWAAKLGTLTSILKHCS